MRSRFVVALVALVALAVAVLAGRALDAAARTATQRPVVAVADRSRRRRIPHTLPWPDGDMLATLRRSVAPAAPVRHGAPYRNVASGTTRMDDGRTLVAFLIPRVGNGGRRPFAACSNCAHQTTLARTAFGMLYVYEFDPGASDYRRSDASFVTSAIEAHDLCAQYGLDPDVSAAIFLAIGRG